ncbi:MAG: molybdenum cofactor biosynthesis protein MoaE [Planctomycetota bacterium]|nr:molybdenum cofactor biosynthesis protein MoaE [Planctomycetota bacterium]
MVSSESPFGIVSGPIDAEAVRAAVAAPDCGAIVVFHGAARDHTGDRLVERLEYEAYAPMAIKLMTQLGAEIVAEHQVRAVACTHRVGPVPIGEDAMVVAVASPHRAAALAATADFIARLKRDVPIWKKEHFDGGAAWIGTPENPQGEGLQP